MTITAHAPSVATYNRTATDAFGDYLRTDFNQFLHLDL